MLNVNPLTFAIFWEDTLIMIFAPSRLRAFALKTFFFKERIND